MIDLAALERLLAEAIKPACDRATPCTSLCWRSVPVCARSEAAEMDFAESVRNALPELLYQIRRLQKIETAARALLDLVEVDGGAKMKTQIRAAALRHQVCEYCVGLVERLEEARRETRVALAALEIAEVAR